MKSSGLRSVLLFRPPTTRQKVPPLGAKLSERPHPEDPADNRICEEFVSPERACAPAHFLDATNQLLRCL